MATTVTKTIGSDSADHATITLWEAATDNDLVAADEIQIGQLQDQEHANTTVQVTIAGSTVDSTRYRELNIVAGADFDPTDDSGAFVSYSGTVQTFSISEGFFRQEGFGYVLESPTTMLRGFRYNTGGESGSVRRVTMKNNCVGALADGFEANPGLTAEPTYENCTFWQNSAVAVSSSAFSSTGACDSCVVVTSSGSIAVGFAPANAATAVRNCISIGATTTDFHANATTTTCISGDATGDITSETNANIFVDAANGDFSIVRASAANGAGTDLSGTFTTDAAGVTRGSTWDIGSLVVDFRTVTATIGATGDHATITLWEAATDDDLFTANEIRIGQLQGQEHAQAGVIVNIIGSNVDATRYREVNIVAGADFDASGVSGARVSGSSTGVVLSTTEAFLRLEGFGILAQSASTMSRVVLFNTGAESGQVRRVTIRNECVGVLAAGFQSLGVSAPQVLENCTVWQASSVAMTTAFRDVGACDNCIVVTSSGDFGVGFDPLNAATAVRNCISIGATTTDFHANATTTTCISGDATGDITGETTDAVFKDATNGDFHVTNSGAAKDAGTFLATVLIDAAGNVRPIPPSIGSLEAAFLSNRSATTAPPFIVFPFE